MLKNGGMGSLPIPDRMLNPLSKEPWKVETSDDGKNLHISTPYFVIRIHAADGGGSQLELDSRPAFEVVMLSRAADTAEPHVVLIRKKRLEQTAYRDVEWITKVPGGYFHDGSPGNLEFVRQRLLQETGMEVDPESVHFIGQAIGHTEIRTPIALGYATRYRKVQEPRAGVEVLIVSLTEALQMAENALSRISPFLENETAFEELFGISKMLERHEIAIPSADSQLW